MVPARSAYNAGDESHEWNHDENDLFHKSFCGVHHRLLNLAIATYSPLQARDPISTTKPSGELSLFLETLPDKTASISARCRHHAITVHFRRHTRHAIFICLATFPRSPRPYHLSISSVSTQTIAVTVRLIYLNHDLYCTKNVPYPAWGWWRLYELFAVVQLLKTELMHNRADSVTGAHLNNESNGRCFFGTVLRKFSVVYCWTNDTTSCDCKTSRTFQKPEVSATDLDSNKQWWLFDVGGKKWVM